MPIYQSEAVHQTTGELARDFVEADTQEEARSILYERNYFVTKISLHNDGQRRTRVQHVAKTLPDLANSIGRLLLELLLLAPRLVFVLVAAPCRDFISWLVRVGNQPPLEFLKWLLIFLLLLPLVLSYRVCRLLSILFTARKTPVHAWGIDVGQCAIKALRCTMNGDQIVADAFDFIEYPKILSEPDAEPEQLINEALETLVTRNDISSACKVAISVPGQSGLTTFFKLPPVDSKRVSNLVKHEATRQIQHPLEELVWDYQVMPGRQEWKGFILEGDVGLLAMEQGRVQRVLRTFETADIHVDIVQLDPASIYNFVSYDILTDGPEEDLFDPDDPPESIVAVVLGTDVSDLVVTNGFQMWRRSIPIGGNHFTMQLMTELKLSFAKAEHLKRNARQAEDPKTVFQALRPIFKDLVKEIQRSIGEFLGANKKAKIRSVVLLGNPTKLPGLQTYMSKYLGYEVVDFECFNELLGTYVIGSPQFSENVLAYGVCYGLCLQGLGKARLSTNLLPRPKSLTSGVAHAWERCISASKRLFSGSFRQRETAAEEESESEVDQTVSTSTKFKYDVFISYSHKEPDREFATDLRERLNAEGYSVCLDEDSFLLGSTFQTEMRQKLCESQVTIAIFSAAYLESENCMFEAYASLILGMMGDTQRLIPFFMERNVGGPRVFSDLVGIQFLDYQPLSNPYDRLFARLRALIHDHS